MEPDGIDDATTTEMVEVVPGKLPTADPRAQQYYDLTVEDLNAATAGAEAVTADLIGTVTGQLAGALGELNALYDEIVGATDVQLTDGGLPLFKLIDSVYKTAAKTIGGAMGELMVQGFQLPPSTSEMTSAMDGDFLQLVANAVPQLVPYLGVEPTGYASPPLGSSPYDPGLSGSEPLPAVQPGQWYPPGEPPYTGDPGFYEPAGSSPPPPPGSSPGTDPVCCPAPVNVTVNVPPIVMPPYAPPGSSPAYSTTTNNLIQPFANPAVPPPPPGPSYAGSTPSSLLFPLSPSDLQATNAIAVAWGDVSGCNRIAEIIDNAQGAKAVLPAPNVTDPIKAYIDSTFGGSASQALWGNLGPNIGKFKDIAKTFTDSTALIAQSALATLDDLGTKALLSTFAPQNVPNPVTALHFGSKVGAAALAEKKTGMPLTYLAMGDLYGFQYANPQFLPNQIRTDNAFLSNQINESTWVCWTRANGNLPEPARRVMNADQLKPNLADLITLYRRGNLAKEDLPKRARELGVMEPAYIPEWLEATKQLPTQSDLIRFMVRDAADKGVVDKYGYDNGFESKFPGQMQKWATALGLDLEYFKYQWRVHWTIPSYTQLTEMLTRLRRDRLEVREWEAVNGPWAPDPPGKPTPGKPRVVTLDDVRQALQINDLAPGWVDEMVSIAYTPINRTDSVRAYMMGAFDDAQLLDSFQNAGYSPRDAKLMLGFYRQDKQRRQRNVSGTWSPRKVVKYYKASTISRAQAANLLKPVMPSAQMINDVLDGADAELAADEKQVQLRRLKRAYMVGEWSEKDLVDSFNWMELDAAQQQHLLKVWFAEREGRMKQPTVAQLGKWVNLGIIPIDEAERRLINLGYAKIDADRILAAALKWDFGGAPPTAEELQESVAEVVKNQKTARKKADTTLAARLRQILDEAARIVAEINRRRIDAGLAPVPAPVIP